MNLPGVFWKNTISEPWAFNSTEDEAIFLQKAKDALQFRWGLATGKDGKPETLKNVSEKCWKFSWFVASLWFLTFMIEDWWAVFLKEILFFSRTFLKERHQTSKIFSTSLMPLFSAVDDSFVHKGCTKLAANFSKRKHWCPRDPWDWIIYLYMISVNNGHVQWEMEVNNPFPWILWDGTFRCFLNKKTTSFSKRTAMPKLTNSMCLRKHPEKKSW